MVLVPPPHDLVQADQGDQRPGTQSTGHAWVLQRVDEEELPEQPLPPQAAVGLLHER